VESNLSQDQEDKLRDVFSEPEEPAAPMPGPRAAEPAQTPQPAS